MIFFENCEEFHRDCHIKMCLQYRELLWAFVVVDFSWKVPIWGSIGINDCSFSWDIILETGRYYQRDLQDSFRANKRPTF